MNSRPKQPKYARNKAACEAAQAVCVSVAKEKKTAAPPKLFDLTSLQREANRIYGYTAKQTLDLAQSLYEKRLLTYPRTDSSYLTDDMGGTAESIVTLLCGKLPFMAGVGFTPEIEKVLNSKKVPVSVNPRSATDAPDGDFACWDNPKPL